MAIFGLREEIEEIVINKEDNSLVPLYDNERVDASILVTLPGYSWDVTYLHRKVDETTPVTQFDVNVDITLQEYIKISNMIIRVDSPLGSGTQDALGGSGIIDIDIIPNPNDIILSKLPDGRIIIFSITEIERINYNNQGLFKISYKSYAEIHDIQDPIYIKLMDSIYEELIYNKDFRIDKVKPLYTTTEVRNRKELTGTLERLLIHWNNMFIIPEHGFYVVTKNKLNGLLYDPYLEKFIRNIVGLNNLDNSIEIIDFDYNIITVLDYILNDNYSTGRLCKHMTHVSSNNFGTNPYLMAMMFTGVSSVIQNSNTTDDLVISNNTTVNEFFPMVDNKYYIFRESIYKVLRGETLTNVEKEELTLFENVFLSMMTGGVINMSDMLVLNKEVFNLDEKELFYFIPIQIYIVKYYLTTFTVKFI